MIIFALILIFGIITPKIFKIIKNIIFTFVMIAGIFTAIYYIAKFTYKWIIVPAFKLVKWIIYKLWLLLQWIGRQMSIHYLYRDDNAYWYAVATSMDRANV